MAYSETVLYFGKDPEFIRSFEDFISARLASNIKIISLMYEQGMMVENCYAYRPSIIYVDFTNIENEYETMFEEIVYLKNYERYRGAIFVAIFADGNYREKFGHVFNSGFLFSFVKGTESDVIFSDSLSIGFGYRLQFTQYATARKINKPLTIGFSSAITAMTMGNFTIETDLELEEDSETISVELPMFEDLEATNFKIDKHLASNLVHNLTDSYRINYPFVEAWDEASNDNMQEDTLETWLDFNSDRFDSRYNFVKIISKGAKFHKDLYEHSLQQPFFIDFGATIDFDSLDRNLVAKTPAIIFFDLEDDEDGENSLSNIPEMVHNITLLEGYSPVIVITNTPSTTSALQKICNYQRVVAIAGPLSVDIFTLLIKSFVEKQFSKIPNLYGNFFKISERQRYTDVLSEVQITSITEHEVTFISPIELPIYTVLHFKLPIDLYATIVPELYDLSASPTGTHYMAIIHGLNEAELATMRKFVNQLIYKPIKELTASTIEKVLAQEVIKDIRGEEEKIEIPPEETKIDEIGKNKKVVASKRTEIKGKSKL